MKKKCNACGIWKHQDDFTHKNKRCDECREIGLGKYSLMNKNDIKHIWDNIDKIKQMARYKDAVKQPGYRYAGDPIPEPKPINAYYPNIITQ